MKKRMRKHLSAPGLLASMRLSFSAIKDPLQGKATYSLVDCLMSGLAIFGLKCPSLLDFDEKRKDKCVVHNLRTLYGVEQAPCDTRLRERLDEVEPGKLQRAYKSGFRAMQRGKVLPLFEFLEGYYLISNDGTGIFHSHSIHCENCRIRRHRDGTVSYDHQILSSVLVHPEQSIVLPMLSEPILRQDGQSKNDCERNASKRLLTQLRTMHPLLKMLLVEDALYANAPHLTLLKQLDYRYIIGVKPDDHTWLFDYVRACKPTQIILKRDSKTYHLRFINDVPLNESHEDIRVNFIECAEITGKGKRQRFTWITDIPVTANNIYQLMRGARARWKIENETFNTLKNQGYHFEHNFGHGYHYLSSVFAHLMMLAFLIDQLQQLCCPFFQKALKACLKKKNLWEELRNYFRCSLIESWEALFHACVVRPDLYLTHPNTS